VIRRIRAFQFDGSAQISLNFRPEINEITDNLAFNPPRIQISIIDTLFDYSSVDTIFSDDNFDPIDIIVIDPGHGGMEDGAVGPKGTREKDIVLDIALKLKQLFEKDENLKVFLTRSEDTTLLLDERAEIANSHNGELFVSIHANWFEESEVQGTQTFFLAAALNDAARATALLENRSILVGKTEEEKDTLDDLSLILVDLLQSEYLSESQDLAADIQAELIKSLRTKNRGIDQAGFLVLNQVFMPSVLIEVAFISNKYEETLLNKDSFRKKAAEGIYRGIKNFIAKYTPER
jgi:N-acetylmuramoyl-L-alanine amidase